MSDRPFTCSLPPGTRIPEHFDHHLKRRLSAMRGQFLDQEAYQARLKEDDELLYEVFELARPHKAGELLSGISMVHPGKIGDEFFMTKGHFHEVLETGEFYFCLQGQGAMVMENPEGDCVVEFLKTDTVLYVPPRWAHRSVNTSLTEDLITLFVYPGEAGHDYGLIEKQGFRKLLLDDGGKVKVVDNPRWVPVEERE